MKSRDWWADTFLAIDQGPIVVMMENYRSGLLWKHFMAAPEVQKALAHAWLPEPQGLNGLEQWIAREWDHACCA